ncbi:arsenate reductase family protein [Paenibacillus sp. 1001270B_150601_E10]|uniref:arsenate reductase family protein n=1 Tax=Paenibacillus sp. 1001270B_150601_E10 TaxID=2787079 RepID=UPI00189F3165|nr:arsenate reductase family protein [Paenibacillus sp. 1001270B_150601_E10]
MKTLTVYHYAKCGTCRKAIKWLNEHGHELKLIPIVDEPPTADELKVMIEQSGLELKKWFNTSGEVYKEMSLKDKLPSMSIEEQIKLLSSNGKLIKRPVVTDGKQVTVGFRENEYEAHWA